MASGTSADQTDVSAETQALPAERSNGPSAAAEPGTTVGRYLLVEMIGQGGMGQVFRAYDPKLRREVALKRLRPHSLNSMAEAKLVHEAQAMARLSHRNVVSVYDVETEHDRVVIAMEYVPGVTLKDWLCSGGRRWPEIVRTFVRAGRGLAAAHAASLVHRDFKPSNVLIAEDGQPKVTDFGIARAAELDASVVGSLDAGEGTAMRHDALVSTHTDAVMGTPRYMAPEQHAGDFAGPAADQFSFCVALWEGLCGRPPYAAGDPDLPLEVAKRSGPPPWPKTISVPRALVSAIERGLAPAPEDRWPSMPALLEALEYDPRARKRRILAGTATMAIVAFGGSTLHAWQTSQARRCSGAAEHLAEVWSPAARSAVSRALNHPSLPYADDVGRRVAEGLDAYAVSWAQQHEQACTATTIRGEQSAAVMDLRMACLHRAKVALQATISVLSEADTTTVENAVDVISGLPAPSRCGDPQSLAAQSQTPEADEIDAVNEARQHLAKAAALRLAGRFTDAVELLQSLQTRLEDIRYRTVRAEASYELGIGLTRLSRTQPAKEALEHALQLALRDGNFSLAVGAVSYLIVAHGYIDTQPDAAMAYVTMALGLIERDDVPPLQRVMALGSIAAALHEQGQLQAAEARFREAVKLGSAALEPAHPELLVARNGLAATLSSLGRQDEAERELRELIEVRVESLGPAHPDVGQSRSNLAVLLNERGRADEAEREQREALHIVEASRGSQADIAQYTNNLANMLMGQGKLAEAESLARKALDMTETHFGPDHPDTARARGSVALTLARQERHAEAAEFLRAALAIRLKAYGGEHPDIAISRLNLAISLVELKRLDEAESELRMARAVAEATLSAEHALTMSIRAQLGRVTYLRGDVPAARRELEQVLDAQLRIEDAPERIAMTAFSLAEVLWHAGERTEAMHHASRAEAAYRDAGAGSVDALREVRDWMAARG